MRLGGEEVGPLVVRGGVISVTGHREGGGGKEFNSFSDRRGRLPIRKKKRRGSTTQRRKASEQGGGKEGSPLRRLSPKGKEGSRNIAKSPTGQRGWGGRGHPWLRRMGKKNATLGKGKGGA